MNIINGLLILIEYIESFRRVIRLWCDLGLTDSSLKLLRNYMHVVEGHLKS